MKGKVLGALLFSALFSGGAATAGLVDNTSVVFSTEDGLLAARGVMRAVRATPESVQFIGCSR